MYYTAVLLVYHTAVHCHNDLQNAANSILLLPLQEQFMITSISLSQSEIWQCSSRYIGFGFWLLVELLGCIQQFFTHPGLDLSCSLLRMLAENCRCAWQGRQEWKLLLNVKILAMHLFLMIPHSVANDLYMYLPMILLTLFGGKGRFVPEASETVWLAMYSSVNRACIRSLVILRASEQLAASKTWDGS